MGRERGFQLTFKGRNRGDPDERVQRSQEQQQPPGPHHLNPVGQHACAGRGGNQVSVDSPGRTRSSEPPPLLRRSLLLHSLLPRLFSASTIHGGERSGGPGLQGAAPRPPPLALPSLGEERAQPLQRLGRAERRGGGGVQPFFAKREACMQEGG